MDKTFKASVLRDIFFNGNTDKGHKLEDLSLWKQLGNWEDGRSKRPVMEWQFARMIFSYQGKYYEYILIRDCVSSVEKWEYPWDCNEDRDEECIEVEKVTTKTIEYRTWNLEKAQESWTGSWCGITLPPEYGNEA